MDTLKAQVEKLKLALAARAVATVNQPARPVIELPELYPLQQQIKSEARRFNVLCVGRRAGKTFLGIRLALETALAGRPVGWFSPAYKFLLEVWRDLTRIAGVGADRINATDRRIEFTGGGLIECWTLESQDAGRSRKYARAIIDEAAAAPNLKTSWEEAIRPTLSDLAGDAWFLSTPRGLNYFHDLYRRGADPLQPDWASWQLPSSVNPFLPPAEIEAAKAELPEMVFRQEFLAEFNQHEGSVFRHVDECLIAPETTPHAHRGHVIAGGIDWGRSHDFTALSLFCCNCRAEVFLDRFNKISWDFQRERLLHATGLWRAKVIQVEKNSIGGPNLEALRDAAPEDVNLIGFETTARSKEKLIQRFALAFERRIARWLPDPIARHELLAFETTITESGHAKYSAPEGGFDDTVVARALAWKAAEANLPLELTAEEKLQEELERDFAELAYVNKLKPGERTHYTEKEQMDIFALELWRSRRKERERNDGRTWSANIVDPNDDLWNFNQ